MRKTFRNIVISVVVGLSFICNTSVAGTGPKAQVIVFMDAQCPCIFSHRETMAEIIHKYGKDVDIKAVFVSKKDNKIDAEYTLNALDWNIPYIVDTARKYVKLYKPKILTECMLISPSGKILYDGAIDDSPQNMGQVKHRYLQDAIKEYLNHNPIQVKFAQGVGCLII